MRTQLQGRRITDKARRSDRLGDRSIVLENDHIANRAVDFIRQLIEDLPKCLELVVWSE